MIRDELAAEWRDIADVHATHAHQLLEETRRLAAQAEEHMAAAEQALALAEGLEAVEVER